MAFEHSLQHPVVEYGCDSDPSIKQAWESLPSSTPAAEGNDGCFDCNICFDSAQDPVVTLCGHLYCWPCMYKWIHAQSSAPETSDQQKCPVCKANVSSSSLIPLYVHGNPSSESKSKIPNQGAVVPRRPTARGLQSQIRNATTTNAQGNATFHQQQYFPYPYGSYTAPSPTTLGAMDMAMLEGMVYAGTFGSSDSSLFTYPYPNPYQPTGSGNRRMRRREMEAEKSLSRVSLFLFCCFVLCLLLF